MLHLGAMTAELALCAGAGIVADSPPQLVRLLGERFERGPA